jgi:hypothetical protein
MPEEKDAQVTEGPELGDLASRYLSGDRVRIDTGWEAVESLRNAENTLRIEVSAKRPEEAGGAVEWKYGFEAREEDDLNLALFGYVPEGGSEKDWELGVAVLSRKKWFSTEGFPCTAEVVLRAGARSPVVEVPYKPANLEKEVFLEIPKEAVSASIKMTPEHAREGWERFFEKHGIPKEEYFPGD